MLNGTPIGDAYEHLLRLGLGLYFQDIASAKTLHALRPRTLPMWDAEIKNWFMKTYAACLFNVCRPSWDATKQFGPSRIACAN